MRLTGAGVRMLVCVPAGQGGVSLHVLHVWMTPLLQRVFGFTADAVMAPGVKQTLRLDAICEPAPCICIRDLLEPGS